MKHMPNIDTLNWFYSAGALSLRLSFSLLSFSLFFFFFSLLHYDIRWIIWLSLTWTMASCRRPAPYDTIYHFALDCNVFYIVHAVSGVRRPWMDSVHTHDKWWCNKWKVKELKHLRIIVFVWFFISSIEWEKNVVHMIVQNLRIWVVKHVLASNRMQS